MPLNIDSPLTRSQVDHYVETGWLITDTLENQTKQLQTWADEVQGWSDDGDWMHYREMTEYGPRLCRTEYFTPFHSGLQSLLTEGIMVDTASALLGDNVLQND